MQPGTSEPPFAPDADPAHVRRQTMGTMLILVGVLFSLAGTGLAASAYLRAVDDPEATRGLMTTLLGTQAPIQLLIGTGAALVGAVALFFGLLLRSVDDLRVPRFDLSAGPAVRRTRDPARERNVRWSAMAALVALFTVSILSAVALGPDVMLRPESAAAYDEEDGPLYEDVWRGAAATSPTAHLQERLSRETGALWEVPSSAGRAVVNVTWTPVDAQARTLRVVVQEAHEDGWMTLRTAEGPSALLVEVPVEGRDNVRVVVERTTADDTRQPVVLHVSFWDA